MVANKGQTDTSVWDYAIIIIIILVAILGILTIIFCSNGDPLKALI